MANRLRELRSSKGLNQNGVGKLVGREQSAISKWERGECEPDHKSLEILADYYGVSIDYILGRSDEPNPGPAVAQESAREVLAGEGVRILLDADANLTEDQLKEIVEFIKFKRRTENR